MFIPPIQWAEGDRCEDFPVISFLFLFNKAFDAATQLSSGLWVGEDGQPIALVLAWITFEHENNLMGTERVIISKVLLEFGADIL